MRNRREEERNEKIIRGLMKLPPNRRCINCNSLGPQYVCTNFWTFVCTTCSGIHREFTHRVKSVSMAKFTSQEVEALQNGGNQRARELFLKDWDLVGMRLPDSSNVDKVRTFIKNVYVDRKYTGVKAADKPPRDLQSLRNYEDQVRRASSYHSYSQSPPYDNQYEDRRYGKQTPVLTRKPGSDRGMYEGKVSSFLYSPGRLSDQTFEDRFANEGSVSQTSDYSTSSGGDQFRSVTQSPSFDETGFNSPCSAPPCRETTERRTVGAPLPQKTLSVNSSGSFHINPVLLNSGNLKDVVSRPQQSAVLNCNTKSSFCSVPPSSISGNSGGLNLFDAPFASESVSSSASTIDLFQPPATSSDQSVHLFQSSPVSSAPSMPLYIPSQITPELSAPKNDGWATFDAAQSTASSLGNDFISHKTAPTCGHSLINVQSSSPSNTSIQQSSSGNSNATTFASLNSWQTGLQRFQDSTGTNFEHPWNAFEDSISQHSIGSNQHNTDSWAAVKPSFVSDPVGFKAGKVDGIKVVHHGDVSDGVPSASQAASQFTGPSYTHSDPFSVVGSHSHASELKSTNPFDMPYDSVDPSDSLDVSSLQSALPPSFLEGVSEAWFPQHQVTTCIGATPQGGLGYIAGAAPVSQLPGASMGGRNPFA